MSAAEFKEEVDFMELSEKIKDVRGLFTNELIDEINDFDSEKIKAEAHNLDPWQLRQKRRGGGTT